MSRGLGRLQRQILDTLDRAKATALPYIGSGADRPGFPYDRDPAGWLWYDGGYVRLAPEAYDLRCSSAYLRGHCLLHGGNTGSLNAAFPRAVKSLVDRGDLWRLPLVPLAEMDRRFPCRTPCQVLRFAEGLYLDLRAPRQIRFVSRERLVAVFGPEDGDAGEW
jgi:hypothetical protein